MSFIIDKIRVLVKEVKLLKSQVLHLHLLMVIINWLTQLCL
jgi:hypothetical protein